MRLAAGAQFELDLGNRVLQWISDRLGGREVSSGAVRNNCTKLAGAGHINPESGYGPWPAVHGWVTDRHARMVRNR